MNDIFTELGDPDVNCAGELFVESSEVAGLLHKCYTPLIEQLQTFMSTISSDITRFISDPEVELMSLKDAIRDFKDSNESLDMIPEPIDPVQVAQQKRQITAAGKLLDPVLSQLSQLRGKIAFGGNFIRAIVRRPKVYNSDYTDSERYGKTNENLRVLNRALDWAEKVLLNLYNLVDQDLNLLTLVNAVYLKHHIYESADTAAVTDGTIAPITASMITDDYFKCWFFTTDEFINMDDTFDFDILVTNESAGGYVYGYYINGNIEGVIRLRADHNAISMLFVNPAMESKGIGQALLRHVIRKFGNKTLRLNVFANNERALRIYRKYDFVVTRETTIEQGEGDDDRFVGHKLYGMEKTSVDSPDNRLNYDPPMPPDRLPEHLRSDKCHMWRAMTGIELIHKEPTVVELERIWMNWQRMTVTQKTISDVKSKELFGLSNEDHYVKLIHDQPDQADDSNPYTEAIDVGSTELEQPEPESEPKKIDNAESSKNGVKRKELYIAFIEYAKRCNPKNTFGSVFDKDAFNVTYPFVPAEMRYFYRLANPLLCVLEDNLTFFSLSELRKLNTDNKAPDKELIFAANEADAIVFNLAEKAVYRVGPDGESETPENTEPAVVRMKLADTFDEYLEHLAGVRVLAETPV